MIDERQSLETPETAAPEQQNAPDKPARKKRILGLRPAVTPARLIGFLLFSVFLLLGTLLIAATFTDREVAETLFIGENWFTVLFDVVGKLPGYLMLFIGAVVLFRCVQRKQSAGTVFLNVIYGLIAVGSAALLFLAATERIENGILRYCLSLGLAAASAAASLVIVQKFPRKKVKPLEKWAVLAVLTVGCIIVATGGLKLIWGRVRYLDDPAFAQFTPWYRPAHANGGDSFPSGHTALSAGILLLPLFVRIVAKRAWPSVLTGALSAALIVLTPIARLMGGYHYLSDVTTSLLLAFAVFTVFYLLLFARGKTAFSGRTRLEKLFFLGPDPEPPQTLR